MATARAARQGLQAVVLGQDSACHRRFPTEASDWNLGFEEWALYWCSKCSAVEPGTGQMGNMNFLPPSIILRPGQTYRQTCMYRLATQ